MIEVPDEDIPDISEIEGVWSDITGSDYDRLYAREQFRRWLAENDAQVLRDAADGLWPGEETGQRAAIRLWLRARADRIASGAPS